jgi:hypothetical protein
MDLMNIEDRSVKFDGLSRFEQIRTGGPVPEEFSVAFDLGSTLKSVVHPPYFYFRADEDYIITPSKYGLAGDEFLFELTNDERGLKGVAGSENIKSLLRNKLTEFLQEK